MARDPKGPQAPQGFPGLVGDYKRVIPNFNKLAHSLPDLLKDGSDMVWRGVHSRAVRDLKKALTSVAALQNSDPDNPVVIKADASKHPIRAVLEQDRAPMPSSPRRLGNLKNSSLRMKVSRALLFMRLLSGNSLQVQNKHVTIETDHARLSRILSRSK